MMILINSYKNGVWENYFQVNQNLSKESLELTLKTREIFNEEK